MPLLKSDDVTLLQLRDTVLCVECELISYNNSTNCLACGSSALMSLARVLGGSLRDQSTANLVDDETLGKIVHDTLDWIPLTSTSVPTVTAACSDRNEDLQPAGGFLSLPRFNPAAAMRMVVERAFGLTRAHGAALALQHGNRMLCQAHAGTNVPDIGSEVHTDSGLSGLCVRTAQTWRCDDARCDPHVNRQACRDLGIRSVIAAPLNHLHKVLGVLQVLSSEAFAFDDRDVATVQLLSNLLVMAFARRSDRHVEPVLDMRLNPGFAAATASFQ